MIASVQINKDWQLSSPLIPLFVCADSQNATNTLLQTVGKLATRPVASSARDLSPRVGIVSYFLKPHFKPDASKGGVVADVIAVE